MRKNVLIIATLILVLSVVSCAKCRDSQIPKVVVSGNSSIELKADMVRFNVAVSELADTTRQAQEMVNKKVASVLSVLKGHDIDETDIRTRNLEIYTSYDWDNGKQIRRGECVNQSLYVTVRNIDEFGTIIDELGDISGISVNSVSFDVSDKNEALSKARELAFLDAKDKAEIYCKVSGVKLGKPILINESYSTYNARTLTEEAVADSVNGLLTMKSAAYAGGTEVPSGQISVKVNLNCEFTLR